MIKIRKKNQIVEFVMEPQQNLSLKITGLTSSLPAKLRFENQKSKQNIKLAFLFCVFFDLFVTPEGFKPPTLRAEI